MDGQKLAMRFSYIVNKKEYCGPTGACHAFEQAFSGSEDDSTSTFKKFEGLLPYLEAIAKKSDKEFLDHDVVEAYWIGNDLLEGFSKNEMQEIVRYLGKRGMTKSLVEHLVNEMPEGFFPHHNFNVFYVGVGNTSGKAHTTLENMDNCRISWGKVMGFTHEKVTVRYQPLEKVNNTLVLGKEQELEVDYLPDMYAPQLDDIVALHWKFVCLALTTEQQIHLEKYTQEILDVCNAHVDYSKLPTRL